jgi:hypothetical protein
MEIHRRVFAPSEGYSMLQRFLAAFSSSMSSDGLISHPRRRAVPVRHDDHDLPQVGNPPRVTTYAGWYKLREYLPCGAASLQSDSGAIGGLASCSTVGLLRLGLRAYRP